MNVSALGALRQFGATDMRITPIGFGTWAIGGGDWAFGWGPQDDEASIAAIRRGLDAGINWIDTAPVYGLGHSEEVVGRVLKERRADRPYVFTKSGRCWNERREPYPCLKKADVKRQCEDSLRHLGVEQIDLLQVHWPQPDEDLEEGWSAMAELQREGKVRYLGACNFDVGQLKRVQAIAPVVSLQPPYSLVRREVEAETLPYCQAQGIGVIAYSPMQSGLLTDKASREWVASLAPGDWRRRNAEFREPRLDRNLALVEVLRGVARRHGRSVGEVAIAWVLGHPAVTAAIVGARNPGQVDGFIGAADLRLDETDRTEIERFLAENP